MIHYYTIVSVDGKGLNTIIPNLLKESEQGRYGRHAMHGSLNVLAAEVSWVAQWAWRLVVFSRQIHRGYHILYGLLCLLWLFNKNEVHSLSGDQVMIGTTFLLNSGLLNLKYHRITSETTLVIRNVQKYVSFLKKITLYADNRYGKMHLCLFAAKRCCYP